jgi:integrase
MSERASPRPGLTPQSLTLRSCEAWRRIFATRPYPWTGRELAAFLKACGENRYRTLYTFLALTGCRRGEALGLHWSEVDLEAGVARIRYTTDN